MADLILLLSVINDYLKNRNHDSEIMKIFERTIEHIKKNKLKKHQGKLLVKCTDDYLSAYISNGNSGLIIELIRYSKITKLNKYNDFILDLSKILNVSYAKDTGFTHGLSGIGYANLELFRYFKNYIFLSNALNICGKLEMYTVNSKGDVYLCNPSLDSISFDFFSGITGQIFLLDQTHSQVMEVMKNEKISQRI